MNKADRAEQLFREGYNCAQSVFGAFAEDCGLTLEQAMGISSAFGAGIGKMRGVCGAVSGMMMALGMLDGYTKAEETEKKKEVYHKAQAMAAEFREKQGSMICAELLNLKPGEDLPEPAVRTEEYYASRPCIGAVRCGAEIAERYLLK